MKKKNLTAMLLFILVITIKLSAQNMSRVDSLFWASDGWRCGVAHINKDGVFSCDFKGTLYPENIFDSTIRRWFIKMVNKDSLFYYRHDVERLYVWRDKDKTGLYGYQYEYGCKGCGITMPKYYDKSIGDTIRIMEQVWDKNKN